MVANPNFLVRCAVLFFVRLGSALTLLLSSCVAQPLLPEKMNGQAGATNEFGCGGSLEESTWALWEQRGLPFLRQHLVAERLYTRGDTYALYNIQNYFHNLAALAQRCQRPERMRQFADALMPVFDKLEPLPGNSTQRAWLCRGGEVCNTRNKLINTEVMLTSMQGLGFMSSLAQTMASSDVPSMRSHPFIAATARVSTEHLLRWGDAKAQSRWTHLSQAQADDVKDGSSSLFFTDKPFWMIGIYANLAGLYARQPALASQLTQSQRKTLSNGMREAILFFRARVTLHPTPNDRVKGEKGADIDRGFWRLYADTRYAGYSDTTPPAVCTPQPDGTRKAQLMVDPREVPRVSELGWDISHARRLVHVLAALDQNRKAIQQEFGVVADELPAPDLTRAFGAQLVGSIWNGDRAQPLFTNYWSGVNGWYRVGYDNGTSYCNAGYPPYGLSESFATGGYAVWAQHYPVIGEIARNLYLLAKNGDQFEKAFLNIHYRSLLSSPSDGHMLTSLMFWPTLIQ